MVKSRAHTKGRKRFDSLRRRPQFCGDVDENHQVSQSSQYSQSSSDLVLEKEVSEKLFLQTLVSTLTRFS